MRDIGPTTAYNFAELVSDAKTIFWHGALGDVSNRGFTKGSRHTLDAVITATKHGCQSLIGGSVLAKFVRRCCAENKVTLLSSEDGVFRKLIEDVPLRGLQCLRPPSTEIQSSAFQRIIK